MRKTSFFHDWHVLLARLLALAGIAGIVVLVHLPTHLASAAGHLLDHPAWVDSVALDLPAQLQALVWLPVFLRYCQLNPWTTDWIGQQATIAGLWSSEQAFTAYSDASCTAVIVFPIAKRSCLTARYSLAPRRCSRGQKCSRLPACAARKRCAWPADLKPGSVRSRSGLG